MMIPWLRTWTGHSSVEWRRVVCQLNEALPISQLFSYFRITIKMASKTSRKVFETSKDVEVIPTFDSKNYRRRLGTGGTASQPVRTVSGHGGRLPQQRRVRARGEHPDEIVRNVEGTPVRRTPVRIIITNCYGFNTIVDITREPTTFRTRLQGEKQTVFSLS